MRDIRICWNDYNMLLACVASLRSPDPNTQVGAYICTQDNRPLSMGYNGTPRGINPIDIPWDRENEDPLQTKYPFIAHAEKNAILHSSKPLAGSKLYVTMYPCNVCAIDIIQSEISTVYYLTNPYINTWQTQAAADMFKKANIDVQCHNIDRQLFIQTMQQLDLKVLGGHKK